MFTDEQIKQLRQAIKEEVNNALEPVKKQLNDLAEMDKQILIEVGEHHQKLEKRVDRIEEHLHLSPPSLSRIFRYAPLGNVFMAVHRERFRVGVIGLRLVRGEGL